MKVAAVVILYHPDESLLINIKTYYDYADKIFVFDNSDQPSSVKDNLLLLPKIIFHQDFDNKGIARRLNEACVIAKQENFEWLLTMDQDSSFSSESVLQYFDCFHQYKNRDNVAMFGTAFSRQKSKMRANCQAAEVDKLITSGSLLNLSLYDKTGNFDEALFIDSVDYDYCFRSIIAGFKIIRFPGIYIFHSVGREVFRSSIKSLFLIKKRKEIHSPLRIYYMYRNMLYLKKKYKNYDKKFISQILGYVISRIKVSVLYGRDTLQFLRYLIIARNDFMKNKMGKIDGTRF